VTVSWVNQPPEEVDQAWLRESNKKSPAKLLHSSMGSRWHEPAGRGRWEVLVNPVALVTSVHIIKHQFSEPWPTIVPCDRSRVCQSTGCPALGCHGVVGHRGLSCTYFGTKPFLLKRTSLLFYWYHFLDLRLSSVNLSLF